MIEFSYQTRPRENEEVSGDAIVVRPTRDGQLLIVVDALGHGHRAAEVADRATEAALKVDVELDAVSIMRELHHAVMHTRGAAALVCRASGARVEGCGIGNVELRVMGSQIPVVLSPGILGVNVQRFRAFAAPVSVPTRLVAFSDGIGSRFSMASLRSYTPEQACAHLLEHFGKSHDDASVVVADISPVGVSAGVSPKPS